MKSNTTEEIMEKATQRVEQMLKAEKSKLRKRLDKELKPRRPRPEVSFMTQMAGLAAAARQIAEEDRAMASKPITERIQ